MGVLRKYHILVYQDKSVRVFDGNKLIKEFNNKDEGRRYLEKLGLGGSIIDPEEKIKILTEERDRYKELLEQLLKEKVEELEQKMESARSTNATIQTISEPWPMFSSNPFWRRGYF